MAIITTIDQPFHPVTYRNAAIKATPQRRSDALSVDSLAPPQTTHSRPT